MGMNNVVVSERVERKLPGTIGAFLGAMVGGLAFFLLNQVGFVASITGAVGAFAAIYGYVLLGKRLSKYGIVISLVALALMMAVAAYFDLAKDVYEAYQEWYHSGEVAFTLTFGESLRYGYYFLEESDIARSYLGNLALGYFFAAIGCIGAVKSGIRKEKNKALQEEIRYQNSVNPQYPYGMPEPQQNVWNQQNPPQQNVWNQQNPPQQNVWNQQAPAQQNVWNQQAPAQQNVWNQQAPAQQNWLEKADSAVAQDDDRSAF